MSTCDIDHENYGTPFCRRCGRDEVRESICRWCGDRGGYADTPEPRRDFYFTNETWYFGTGPGKAQAHWPDEGIFAEVMFGWNVPGGGTLGEMAIRWYAHGKGERGLLHATPRLEVYCDAWVILARFKDVIDGLAELDSTKRRRCMTPQEFCDLLLKLGFVDATPRHGPPGEWTLAAPRSEEWSRIEHYKLRDGVLEAFPPDDPPTDE